MSRAALIRFHLVLAAFFLPLLLLIPLSGGLYLAGIKGSESKEPVFEVVGTPPADEEAQLEYFRDLFAQRNLNFEFEYIRTSGDVHVFRPSSRVHFQAVAKDGVIAFFKVTPDFPKRLIEIHKGHGPIRMKWLQQAFAISLVLVALSGLSLALTVKSHRKFTFLSLLAGLLVTLTAMW